MMPFFWGTPLKTNMTMENQPFEDVFHIKHRDFPAIYISFCQGTQPQSQ